MLLTFFLLSQLLFLYNIVHLSYSCLSPAHFLVSPFPQNLSISVVYILFVKMVSILSYVKFLFCLPSVWFYSIFWSFPSFFFSFLSYLLFPSSFLASSFIPPAPNFLVPYLTDSMDSDLELSMVRHQPEGLEQLQAQTQFTRKELQSLYRGFKNVWKQSFKWGQL